MIHQSVSPYIKYTSLILFEVIVEADVWICFGKLLDFWSISVTISVVFFQRLENIMQFCEEKPQEPMQDVYIHIWAWFKPMVLYAGFEPWTSQHYGHVGRR